MDLKEPKQLSIKSKKVLDKLKCQISSKNENKMDTSSGRLRDDSDEIEMPVVRNETEHREPLIRIQEPLNPHLMNAIPGILHNNLNRINNLRQNAIQP